MLAQNIRHMTYVQEPVVEHHINSNGWVAFLSGIIMSTWSLLGYDASAHMIEETLSADVAAKWSFILTTGLSIGSGFLYLLALCIGIRVIAFKFYVCPPLLPFPRHACSAPFLLTKGEQMYNLGKPLLSRRCAQMMFMQSRLSQADWYNTLVWR